MEPQHTIARSLHLRQSYIEISKYLRSRGWYCGPAPRGRSLRCRAQRFSTTTPAKSSSPRVGRSFRIHQVSPSTWPSHSRLYRREISSAASSTSWDKVRRIDQNPASLQSDSVEQNRVQLYGYTTSRRSVKGFDFIQLVDPRLQLAVQLVLPHIPERKESTVVHNRGDQTQSGDRIAGTRLTSQFDNYQPHVPVLVSGTIVRRQPVPQSKKQPPSNGSLERPQGSAEGNDLQKLDPHIGKVELVSHVEVLGDSIEPLNTFDYGERQATTNTVFPPELRHLQFRTDSSLRERIRLRSRLSAKIRQHMLDQAFDEIETPLLFKSTPEGAREFIVPTRRKGMAYALPQSPQQYKQILMASGIHRYFQFAKCFRDEDLRADRQPEFTQVFMAQIICTIDLAKFIYSLTWRCPLQPAPTS